MLNRFIIRAGLYQRAYMHILSAGDSCPPQLLYVEQAQLYWQKGCQENAFTTLKRSFSNCFQPVQYYKQLPSDVCNEERKQCAKVRNAKRIKLLTIILTRNSIILRL